MPYWWTASKPDFHTRVTSQAFVAWSRHERKAETAFPPTIHVFISGLLSIVMSAAGERRRRGERESGNREVRVRWLQNKPPHAAVGLSRRIERGQRGGGRGGRSKEWYDREGEETRVGQDKRDQVRRDIEIDRQTPTYLRESSTGEGRRETCQGQAGFLLALRAG
jgi:hypothetical protein